MFALRRLPRKFVKRPDLRARRFSNVRRDLLPIDQKVEEEVYDDATKHRYFPIKIGDLIGGKYEVLGNLGYGRGSTVWLASRPL